MISHQPDHLPKNQFQLRAAHWILLCSLIGFGLRLQQLGFQPLWGDEGWSFFFAAQPLPNLLALTAADIHPPLYYLLLKAWLFIVGTGPEEARFFSVLAGTLLIPALGLLGWRLFNRNTGLIAAAITAIMPLAIYYSQEVRMYGLVTLLGVLAAYFFIRQANRPPGKWQGAYVVTIAAAMYTMYYAAFIVFFQLLYSLWAWRRSRQSLALLAPFVYAGLLYLPWLLYTGQQLPAYVQNKRAVEGYLPLNFIQFFWSHFAAFSIGHVVVEPAAYAWAAMPFVLLVLAGFVVLLSVPHKSSPYLYLYLFTPLLLGYLVNRLFPFTPPYFERTLLLAAPAFWLLGSVGLVWLWNRQRLLAGLAAAGLLGVSGASLAQYYNLPRYPHADYRPLLQDVAARATAEDTLLASYQWQLGFYYAYLPEPQPRFFSVPGWGEAWAGPAGQDRLVEDVSGILARSPRLWFPAYQAAGHLWEDEAEAVMAELGYPALLAWYGPETKLSLVGSAQVPLVPAPAADFAGRLSLLRVEVGQASYEAGRGIVPVALTWRKETGLDGEHRVNLRLVDATGRTWASRDSYPRAGQVRFEGLAPGQVLEDRHGLLVAAGTPPGLYRLLLSVRRTSDAHPLDMLDAGGQPLGAELHLADVAVVDPQPPVSALGLPVQVASDAVFGQDVRLAGYSLGSGPFKAGEVLSLSLFWESLASGLAPLQVVIQLEDETGQPVVTYQAEPARSTVEWGPGFILRDPHDVLLPAALRPGRYRLLVGLTGPDQTRLNVAGQDRLFLAMVTTLDRPRTFTPPQPQLKLDVSFNDQARLAGLDLPRQAVRAGESLPLTLYWQVLAEFDKSWTVFVHLVDQSGRIISQQDQLPGGGQFPTTGWLPGEYLTDTYHLSIPGDIPPGDNLYRLEIGLYDPNDFSRLPIMENGQISGNSFVLKNWPISVELDTE